VTALAIIGGSGLTTLKDLRITRREVVRTPYGEPSGPLVYGELAGCEVVFLARHGLGHTIPPHMVNYRANLWSLREAGARTIIAVAAVGGIRREWAPSSLVIPDQIIDYTYSRAHTFFDGGHDPVTHVDFTSPYCQRLRAQLIAAGRERGLEMQERGTYAATQGPRFESAAEIDRLERDGADVVGMTGMPETGLARELELCYATVAVIANLAAGRGEAVLSVEEIGQELERGMTRVRALLEAVVPVAACG